MARNFNLNVSDFAAKKEILPEGFYAAQIVKASIADNDGKPFISIFEEEKTNKKTKLREKTGNWVLRGSINFQIMLLSKKARKILLQDEPRLFSRISLNFNQENGDMEINNNVQFRQLIDTFNLDVNVIGQATEAEQDQIDEEAAKIPEELVNIPNIEQLWKWAVEWQHYFNIFCQMLANEKCRVKVIQQQNFKDKSITEAAIDVGNWNAPSTGFLAYNDGCEEDLED